MQQLTVHADVVAAGVGFRSQLGDDLTVDLDAALLDQFLGAAAAGHPGSRQNLLQPLQLGGRARLGISVGLGLLFFGL